MIPDRHSRLLADGLEQISAEDQRPGAPLHRPGNRPIAVVAHFDRAPEFAKQEFATPGARRMIGAELEFDFFRIDRSRCLVDLAPQLWIPTWSRLS